MNYLRLRPWLGNNVFALTVLIASAGCATSPMSRIDAKRSVYESWPVEMQEAVLQQRAIAGMTPEIAAALLPHLSLAKESPGMARSGPAVQQPFGGLPPAIGMAAQTGGKAGRAGPGVYVIRAATVGVPALNRRATVQLGCGVGALTCLRIAEWARIP